MTITVKIEVRREAFEGRFYLKRIRLAQGLRHEGSFDLDHLLLATARELLLEAHTVQPEVAVQTTRDELCDCCYFSDSEKWRSMFRNPAIPGAPGVLML